jgi:hypothetical protein
MKQSLLAMAVVSALMPVTRAKTRDVAFQFRMGAGFAGDVNRTHPFSVLPALQDAATPVRLYGDAVLGNPAANSVKGFAAGDTALTKILGVAVRPYPTQQQSGAMSASIGASAPPGAGNIIDYLRFGHVMVKINPAQAVRRGDPVFVWCAATAGADVQGGFRGAVSAGNTAAIANAFFMGPADASGNTEIEVFPA